MPQYDRSSPRSRRRRWNPTPGAPNLGVAVDVYHVWWDPGPLGQTSRAPARPGVFLAFHVCDWLVPTRDLLTDRGMMGDGVIDIPIIRERGGGGRLADQVEVEIFSDRDWWTRPTGRNPVGLCGASPERCVRLRVRIGRSRERRRTYSPRKSGLRFSRKLATPRSCPRSTRRDRRPGVN